HKAKPATHRAATRPASRAATTHRTVEPTIYRATFNENVHVFEAQREVAQADVMLVDFLQESGKQAPTSAPAKQEKKSAKPRVAGGGADELGIGSERGDE